IRAAADPDAMSHFGIVRLQVSILERERLQLAIVEGIRAPGPRLRQTATSEGKQGRKPAAPRRRRLGLSEDKVLAGGKAVVLPLAARENHGLELCTEEVVMRIGQRMLQSRQAVVGVDGWPPAKANVQHDHFVALAQQRKSEVDTTGSRADDGDFLHKLAGASAIR